MGWKIVRDLQPGYCEKNGVSGSWRTAENPVKSLGKKLFEEASEFTEDYDPAELYDLHDVVLELLNILDPDGRYAKQHILKVLEVGSFRSI